VVLTWSFTIKRGIFTMKKLNTVLLAIAILPGAVFAQTPDYEGVIYVVQQQNTTAAPDEALDELCAGAKLFLGGRAVVGAARSDLYSVTLDGTDGSILTDDVAKVGEIAGCTGVGGPEMERVEWPTRDFGQVAQLTLHGKQYTVTGSSRLRTNPDPGFPGEGMFLSGMTGTISKPFELGVVPEVVGAMTANTISIPGKDGNFVSQSLFTIRLYEEPAPVNELDEYWKSLGY
jgi:hypothetical protein